MHTSPALSLRKLLVLSVLFLVPGASLAAQEPSPVPGTQASAPRHLAEDYGGYDDYDETNAARTPGLGMRLLAESALGVVTSLGMGLGGALASGGICTAFKLEEGFLACLDYALLGYLIPAFVGLPLGVWGGGEVAGGDGRFVASILGAGVGTMISFGLGMLLRPQTFTGVMMLGLIPLGSAIASYELFQRDRPRLSPAPVWTASRARVQPTVTVSSRGAGLGLLGSF